MVTIQQTKLIVNIPVVLNEKVNAAAKKRDRSKASFVRTVLREYLGEDKNDKKGCNRVSRKKG